MTEEALSNLLTRGAPLPAAARVRGAGERHGRTRTTEAAADRLDFWERQAARLRWAQAVGRGARLVERAVRASGSSAARSTSASTASTVTSSPVTATRSRSTGRASRATPATITYADLLARGVQGGERADRARRRRRRPRRDLPADDPRGRRRDARVRAHRRTALGRLRRLLRRRARRPHRRRAGASFVITADGGYRRGKAVRAQADGRRGGRAQPAASRRCSSCAARGEDVAWDDERDVWWHDVVDRQPDTHEARAVRQRAPAVHPLHVRHDGEAEGHPAHDRRLPHARRVHAPRGVRPQAGHRRLLVHRRHRLGHRPLLHRLRTAREPRDAGHVRGHAGHPAPRPDVGDRREVQRLDPLHGADADPHVHEVGRGPARRATTCRRCGCSAASASRSIRRRGCGTATSSAATAARSSTRGGRPRPAAS